MLVSERLLEIAKRISNQFAMSERYFLIRNSIFLVFANEEKELICISQKGRWNDEGRAIAPGIDSIIDLRPIFQRKGKIISRKNRIGCS